MLVISTKQDPEEAREATSPAVAGESPMYPYGTRITLDDSLLAKLGIALPPVGTSYMMMARVEVVSSRADRSADGEAEIGVDLQITDLGLELADEKDPTSKLWPE